MDQTAAARAILEAALGAQAAEAERAVVAHARVVAEREAHEHADDARF